MNYNELHRYLTRCKRFKRALPRAYLAKNMHYYGPPFSIFANKGITGKLNINIYGIYLIADGSKQKVFLEKKFIFDYLHCPSLGIIHS